MTNPAVARLEEEQNQKDGLKNSVGITLCLCTVIVEGKDMRGLLIDGAMFRILSRGDVLQAHHVFGNWGSMYAIWESVAGAGRCDRAPTDINEPNVC